MNHENLGPAEKILQTVLSFSDHMVHSRPGVIVPDQASPIGVGWSPVTYVVDGGQKHVLELRKAGKKRLRVPIGVLCEDGFVRDGARVVGAYRPAGLFAEAVVWLYGQIADVWSLDNELVARWASHAFGEEHRDLKVVLAAFLLAQSRKGDPVRDGATIVFHDEDYRDVGEAMMLVRRKDGRDLNPKLLLRIHDVLSIPGVAAKNRALGFGQSARRPFLGRWTKAVEKWLAYREANPKLLESLVSAGFRTQVMELARRVGYRPSEPRFFELLRWKQKQAADGRRSLSIGVAVAAAETWAGLSEEQICERIQQDRPGWKRIVGLLPREVGITPAIVACAVESGSFSKKDLVIATPTLEELGLLQVPSVAERWSRALAEAEDLRSLHVAERVKSRDAKDKLAASADTAVKKAVSEVVRDLRVYFFVDVSGSMEGAIEGAKDHIGKFLQAFPVDQLHVAVFNTSGREVRIPHPSAAGVENAFRGVTASGGTDYGAGVKALSARKPKPEEDVLFFFVGDEEASAFAPAVMASGLSPIAFAFLKVRVCPSRAVQETAAQLGIPCFFVEPRTFVDPYAIPRTLRALVLATPVGVPTSGAAKERRSLVETILKTDLLQKPAWASLRKQEAIMERRAGWRDLLRKESEAISVALPWLGGRSLRLGDRRWVLQGALPPEHGWHAFRIRGRVATWSEPVETEASPVPATLVDTTQALREVVRGYLVGDRLVRDDVRVPVALAGLPAVSERVHLVERGLGRFTRIAAGRAYPEGALVYVGPELPLGPEDEVLAAYQERATSIDGIRGVVPALDAAFRLESWQRDAAERRRLALARRLAEEDEARRLEAHRQEIAGRLGDGAGRRAVARVDFAEAARAALAVGGAEYLDERPARTRGERVVWFRLDGRRFECTCEAGTLRIVDAGICLTDHDTAERGDDRFTLESLPSVIRQAEREGKLVVLRHAD